MVSIVIPAYNESEGIKKTVEELMSHMDNSSFEYEVIVVDDGSTDNTYEEIKAVSNSAKMQVLQHKKNRGYGSAIKTASKHAKGEYIAWYDADGQHTPQDLCKLIDTIQKEGSDYCIGIRDEFSYQEKCRKFGKRVLKFVVDVMSKEKTEDFNSGMRIFKKGVLLKYISLLPQRFGASTVTTLLMQELGLLGSSCSITVRQRVGKSSVKQFRDGIRTISLILNIVVLFRPMQVFGTLGFVTVLVGIMYGLIKSMIVGLGFPTLAAIIIVFGLQILLFGFVSKQIGLLRLDILEKNEVDF